MEHLSKEDMIKYVTAVTTDEETLKHITKVHAHVSECEICREKLYTFEEQYETSLEEQLNECLDLQTLCEIENDFRIALRLGDEKQKEAKEEKIEIVL